MKPHHKTDLEDRLGAILGTQPGRVRSEAEARHDAKIDAELERKQKLREARARYRRPGDGPKRTRRKDHRPTKPVLPPPIPLVPTLRPEPEQKTEPKPTPEWDNPYLKTNTPPWELIYRARVRKAQIEAASDPANPVVRADIIKRDKSTCWICRKMLAPNEIDLDHVIPLCRKGKHIPENVKVCCKPCNSWKADRLVSIL